MRIGAALLGGLCAFFVGLSATPVALGKTKRCKRGTVPVKVLRTTTCRPIGRAIPRPQAGDPRVAALDAALGLNLSFVRDRQGHRLRGLSQLGGGRAYRTIIRNLPTALERLDKLAFPHGKPARARLARGCSAGPSPVSGSSAYGVGGGSVSIDSSSNGDSTVTMTANGGNGVQITIQFQVGECSHFDVPSCPTVDGRLEGTDSNPLLLITRITQNGKLLRSEIVQIEETQKLAGQLADDAKLDTLDISDAYRFHVDVGGSQLAHAVNTYGSVVHDVRVNMRTGGLESTHGEVLVNATVDGARTSDADLANLAAQMQKDADAAFAKISDAEIHRFRTLETNIDKPGTCAKLTFNPMSNSLTLNPNDRGGFTGTIESNAGGEPSKARWTLSNQNNATFSPTTSESRQPTISYTVSGSPSGSTVSVAVKATSTAGVDEQMWKQKLKTLTTITGTFTGHATDLGVVYDWTGTATFTRTNQASGPGGGVFQLTAGQATVSVSGSENGSGCEQTGTSTIGLVAQSPWTVTGTSAPYSYTIIVGFLPDRPQATNINCSDVSRDGTPADLGSVPSPALQSGDIISLTKTTNDLFSYTGSASATLFLDPGQTESWTWSFTGRT